MARFTDPNNFPVYREKRTRVQKLTNPQTKREKRRAKRFAGLVGAVAVMAMMPKPELEMYNGD